MVMAVWRSDPCSGARRAAGAGRRRRVQDLGEELAEGRGVAAARREREVEPRELERLTRGGLGLRHDTRGVVLAPPLRIAQRLVRLDDPLEDGAGGPVAGIDAR